MSSVQKGFPLTFVQPAQPSPRYRQVEQKRPQMVGKESEDTRENEVSAVMK